MHSNQPVVIIAGDSWGCGEWSHEGNYQITHQGLTQYLQELGYLTINLSRPAGNNIDCVQRVQDFLKVSKHVFIEQVFVFQTEWTRDLENTNAEDVKKKFHNGYVDCKNQCLSSFYYGLAEIVDSTRVPVHVIGGCSDTIWLDKFDQEYSGVSVICQSVTNLLLNNCHRTDKPVHAIWTRHQADLLQHIKQNLCASDLEVLFNDIELGTQRLQLWRDNQNYFWPDGVHANRLGHKKLLDFLLANIPNLGNTQ